LAGSFVVWKGQTNAGVQRLSVLNLRTGRLRRVGSLLTGGHMIGGGITGFVARGDGTVIWLDDVGSQEGPYSSFTSTLYENSGRTSSVLDRATNARPVFPISSFGLSRDGRLVYWTDNGRLHSAAIS
jgi:hypothetical protein